MRLRERLPRSFDMDIWNIGVIPTKMDPVLSIVPRLFRQRMRDSRSGQPAKLKSAGLGHSHLTFQKAL